MDNHIIVYHDNCHDGITALWAALQAYPEAEAYPGRYDVPPDMEKLRGKDVIVVDFSWKRPVMLTLYHEVCKSLIVLDHHASAEKELEGLKFCIFDMERSGAGLAWDVLVGKTRPALVKYVEDRDLWRFALPFSKAVHAFCASFPLDLNHREMLSRRSVNDMIDAGEAILRYNRRLVESATKHVRMERVGPWLVPAIASPCIEIVSDLGHALCQGHPFAAIYTDRTDGSRSYSLRSDGPDAQDVSEVAKSYGGGGHKNAAGFVLKNPKFNSDGFIRWDSKEETTVNPPLI